MPVEAESRNRTFCPPCDRSSRSRSRWRRSKFYLPIGDDRSRGAKRGEVEWSFRAEVVLVVGCRSNNRRETECDFSWVPPLSVVDHVPPFHAKRSMSRDRAKGGLLRVDPSGEDPRGTLGAGRHGRELDGDLVGSNMQLWVSRERVMAPMAID